MARIALALAAVLVGSAAWRALRPHLILALARSSVGCPVRTELVASALRRLYPQLSAGLEAPNAHILFRQGPTGWTITWRPRAYAGATPKGSPLLAAVRWVFVDGRFNYLGLLTGSDWPSFCGDWDQDGHMEVLLDCPMALFNRPSALQHRGAAIVRLKGKMNEVVGVVAYDDAKWCQSTRVRVKPGWRDEDHDGRTEFVLATVDIRPAGGRRLIQGPSEVLVRFDWTAPGGVLRLSLGPDDGKVLTWSPPDGRPYSFSADTPADALFRELLPLPPDFGTPASQQTSATGQSTSTASQPASAPNSGPD